MGLTMFFIQGTQITQPLTGAVTSISIGSIGSTASISISSSSSSIAPPECLGLYEICSPFVDACCHGIGLSCQWGATAFRCTQVPFCYFNGVSCTSNYDCCSENCSAGVCADVAFVSSSSHSLPSSVSSSRSFTSSASSIRPSSSSVTSSLHPSSSRVSSSSSQCTQVCTGGLLRSLTFGFFGSTQTCTTTCGGSSSSAQSVSSVALQACCIYDRSAAIDGTWKVLTCQNRPKNALNNVICHESSEKIGGVEIWGEPRADITASQCTAAQAATVCGKGVIDLSLKKTYVPSTTPPAPGGEVSFLLTVTNAAGADPAVDVTVVDMANANLEYVRVQGGTCTPAATGVRCSVGNIAPGASVSLTIVFKLKPRIGTECMVQNYALVYADNKEAQGTLGNNYANDGFNAYCLVTGSSSSVSTSSAASSTALPHACCLNLGAFALGNPALWCKAVASEQACIDFRGKNISDGRFNYRVQDTVLKESMQCSPSLCAPLFLTRPCCSAGACAQKEVYECEREGGVPDMTAESCSAACKGSSSSASSYVQSSLSSSHPTKKLSISKTMIRAATEPKTGRPTRTLRDGVSYIVTVRNSWTAPAIVQLVDTFPYELILTGMPPGCSVVSHTISCTVTVPAAGEVSLPFSFTVDASWICARPARQVSDNNVRITGAPNGFTADTWAATSTDGPVITGCPTSSASDALSSVTFTPDYCCSDNGCVEMKSGVSCKSGTISKMKNCNNACTAPPPPDGSCCVRVIASNGTDITRSCVTSDVQVCKDLDGELLANSVHTMKTSYYATSAACATACSAPPVYCCSNNACVKAQGSTSCQGGWSHQSDCGGADVCAPPVEMVWCCENAGDDTFGCAERPTKDGCGIDFAPGSSMDGYATKQLCEKVPACAGSPVACAPGCYPMLPDGTCPVDPFLFTERSHTWWGRFTAWMSGSTTTASLVPQGNGCCCPAGNGSSASTQSSTAPSSISSRLSSSSIGLPSKTCGVCSGFTSLRACEQSAVLCQWNASNFGFISALWGGSTGSCVPAPSCTGGGVSSSKSRGTSSVASVASSKHPRRVVIAGTPFPSQCGDRIVQIERGEQCEPGLPQSTGRACTNACLWRACEKGMMADTSGVCIPEPMCPADQISGNPTLLHQACVSGCAAAENSATCTAACVCACRPGVNPLAAEAARSCVTSCEHGGGVREACAGKQGAERSACCLATCIGAACPFKG